MRLRLALAMVTLLPLVSAPASAGIIAGTLWLSAAAAATHAKQPDAPIDSRAQHSVQDAVVYLESVPDKVERKLAAPTTGFVFKRAVTPPHLPRIVQRDRHFSPRVLAIASGTRVEIQNLDRVYHNAFSVSPAKRFDLGKYPPGQSDTVAFEHVGVINLHCDIHPDELGYVVVTPNHVMARPDSLGRYKLPKLPPGEYAVHVFHPKRGERTRTVTVPRRGNVALDLSF